MDIITQRFIAIGNKLLAELRRITGTLQKLSEAVDEKNATEKSGEQPQPILRAELEIPASIRQQNNAQDRRTNRRENWRLIVEIATALILFGYATLVYFQLKEMIAATGAAQQAVQESRLNRQQSDKALTATIEQFRLDQRAWITVTVRPFTFTSSKPMDANIRFTNIGKTPARHFKGDVQLEVLLGEEKLRIEYTKKAKFPGYGIIKNVLIPGDTQEMPLAFLEHETTEIRPVIASPEIMRRAAIGEAMPVIYGRFTYEDVFGRSHQLRFCQRLLLTGIVLGETKGLSGKYPECGNYEYAD